MALDDVYYPKIGVSNNIGINKFRILSNANVVNPTREQVSIVSTSVNDTTGGSGVRKVKLTYYDNNSNLLTEIININGNTPVLTIATNIFRIETFEVFKAGGPPMDGADGTITLKSLDGTRLFAQIDPSKVLFERALHYVRPKYMGFIKDIVLSCSTAGGVEFMVFTSIDYTPYGGDIVTMPDLYFTLANRTSQISLEIPTLCDASNSSQLLTIGIAVKGLATGQSASTSFKYQDRKVMR